MDIIGKKPVVWHGSSLKDVREFPEAARRRTGRELQRMQLGLAPIDFKPMGSVGIGAMEIRVHVPGAFRVIYVARFPDAIHVFHAFEKKTRKTSKADIDLARERYRVMLRQRREA